MTNSLCGTLDDVLDRIISEEWITSDVVLRGINDLSEKERVAYAGQLSIEIGKGNLDCKFTSNEDKKDVLETLYVIQVCATSELDNMAYHDPLTKLPNKRKLDEEDIPQNTKYAVLMFDIDKFKSWNDTYGHCIGDMALKVVGYVLETNIREGLAGRYGGEEFYGVIKNISSSEKARAAGERVRKSLEEKGMNLLYNLLYKKGLTDKITQLKEDNSKLTISVGFAVGNPGDKLGDTQKYADIALYHAKSNGRNRVVEYKLGMNMPKTHK